ncbi:hypothetical protein IJQ19_00970 [bacterium]|nr:hypothetical protein [bacterium]
MAKRLDGGFCKPEKYFFKVATPELIHKRVGSSSGIKDLDGNTKWSLLFQKSSHV